MRLYFIQSNNAFVAAKYDDELFRFDTATLSPFNTFDIDEVDPINKLICLDLIRTCNKVDEAGLYKYYLSGGQIMQRVGWVEKPYEIF